jgi:hypothetical protein
MEIQMNIKRAFFAAVALLMVPGFALAQTTITFDTQLHFNPTGPYTQTVMATLTCNTGNPLQQTFEIGPTPADKVVFVVDNFDLQTFIDCEITASSLTGFDVLSVLANSDDTGSTCLYEADPDTGTALIEGLNTCVFEMTPSEFSFEIEKVWEFNSEDVDVSDFASINWNCNNVVEVGLNNTVTTISGGFGISGNGTWTIIGQPNPWAGTLGGTTTCWASESAFDSAVESDQGCSGGTTFSPSDLEGGCTITNSVFFEGIPTLSQYGLAVMALLMLGVGFIGFRRFV